MYYNNESTGADASVSAVEAASLHAGMIQKSRK